MSIISTTIAKSRQSYNAAYDLGLQIKANNGNNVDLAEIFNPGSVGILSQLKGADQSKYALFRGWVYSAINAIARQAAQQPVKVGKIVGDTGDAPKKTKVLQAYHRKRMTRSVRAKAADTEIDIAPDSDPLVKSFNHPNNIQHGWQFVYSFVANICLTGYGFILGDKNKDGEYEFYSVPTTWIRPDHTNGAYSGFYIVNPNNPKTYGGKPLDRSIVTFAYLPDPSDPLGALSPATSQNKAFRIDSHIQTSQEAFFGNGIFPSAIVTVGAQPHPDAGVRPRLSPVQRRQVYAAIMKVMGDVTNYGKPAIVDGMIEKIERLSMNQEEMGWEKSEDKVRARILSAFGVHPFILGEVMPGSYAQMAIVQNVFYGVVNTFLDLLGMIMTSFIQEREGDENQLVWWEECVAVDPSMEKSTWEGAVGRGDVSQNEFRAWMGLPPDEDGNQQYIPKEAIPQVLQIAAGVKGGTLDVEQAKAMLIGMGLPTEFAVKIAGKAPPKQDPQLAQAQAGMQQAVGALNNEQQNGGQNGQKPKPEENGKVKEIEEEKDLPLVLVK